jgi:hypothetical protein
MFTLLRPITVAALAVSLFNPATVHAWSRCRNQPGDPGYPTDADWSTLNATIGGRLLKVVPSAEACRELDCTEAQWESSVFRQAIPGSMNAVRSYYFTFLAVNDHFFACTVQLGTGEAF